MSSKSGNIPGLPQSSFSQGEITPAEYGRIDFDGYYKALKTCRNFIPSKYGGVDNRPGTRFVALVNDSDYFTKLIPFQFNTTSRQTYIIELGNYTMRIIFEGALVLSGGSPIVVITPWASTDLPLLKYTQSADVVTVCHPSYQTQEIKRLDADSWTVTPFVNVNGPFLDINTDHNITVYASAVTGSITLTASEDLFTADLIGLDFYLGQSADNSTQIWQVSIPVAVGQIYMFGANYYQAIAGGTTGTYEPTHTQGSMRDGSPGVLWEYLHSGSGIVTITGYTDAKHVSATVKNRLPNSVATQAPVIYSITDITPGNAGTFTPMEVKTANVNTLYTGNSVTIAGVKTSTVVSGPPTVFADSAANGTFLITVIDSTHFYLDDNYSADDYHEGGTVTPNQTAVPSYNWALPAWGGPQGYPGTTSYFQDRQLFGATNGQPFNVWMSTVAGFKDFTVSNPVLDTDGITYKILSNQVLIIRHMLELSFLIIFTSGGPYMVEGGKQGGNGVVTPSTIDLTNQGSNAIGDVPPIKINNFAVFIQEKGQQVRTLGYSFAENAFIGRDITIQASHLLMFNTIIDWAYQETPYSCVWCVRDDGALLSLTFFPEQEVIGWARHDTQGKYESVVCITEDNQDVVYFIVNRPGIGRCIERMAPRQFQDQIDAYFVDCGLTYDGRATNTLAATFTGLDHLEGQTVSILADGMVYPQQVVLNGSVTIPNESLVAHMGLPYTSDFETLEISSAKADLRDKKKAINSVSLIVDKSGTFQAGPDVDHLERPKIRSTEDYNAPDNLLSEIVDVSIPSMWNKAGRIFVRQSDPLPLTILTCIPQVSVGGY